MMTSEIAKHVGVTAETVRFYTRKGLLAASRLPNNGYKFYDSKAVERLKFITQAKNVGFSLKEIQEIIDLSQHGDSPCPTVRQMFGKKILETKQKIDDLNSHLMVMEETYSDWAVEPDMIPDGKAICCLIEKWSDKHQV